MIIDSHVHVWVSDPQRFPWAPIGGYVPETDAPVEELRQTLTSSGVDKAVLVQPTSYGWDNRYLLDAVATDLEKFRAVCLVNPLDPNHVQTMQKLVQEYDAAGFRLNWNLHPLESWVNSHDHTSFWKTAGDLKRPLCIQCTPEYTNLLKTMIERNGDVPVVVDHLGRLISSDGIQNGSFQNLLSLSQYPNVYIKISGFYYCSHQAPPYPDLVPFIKAILDTFGAQRCLWGSDFPFVQQHWSYSGLLEYLDQISFVSESDREWLLGRTAQKLWWQALVD